jgi:hypothetical protein
MKIFFYLNVLLQKWKKNLVKNLIYPIFRISFASCEAGCNAVVDTGTFFILGPKKDIESFANTIGATFDSECGCYMISCNPINSTGYSIY